MSPTKLVYDTLKADAALAALVDGRIYPLRIPQTAELPAIIFQQVSRTQRPLHACNLPDQALVQVSVFAKRYQEVEMISDAIRAALGDYQNGDYNIEYDNGRDLHDDQADTFHRADDYRVEVPVAQPDIPTPPEPTYNPVLAFVGNGSALPQLLF